MRILLAARITFCLWLASWPVIPAHAAQQCFLKINRFYVAYSNPIVPYCDSHGEFQVGLLSMAVTLGVHVDRIDNGESIKLRQGGNWIELTRGSKTVTIDGKVQFIPSLKNGDRHYSNWVGPFSLLIGAFHPKTYWGAQHKVLYVTVADIITYANTEPNNLDHIKGQDPGPLSDEPVPDGISRHEFVTSQVSNGKRYESSCDFISISVKNLSGKSIPPNGLSMDVMCAVYYESMENAVVYEPGGDVDPLDDLPRPALDPGKQYKLQINMDPTTQTILVWPVVSKYPG